MRTRYFYRVDKKNKPIPHSNFKAFGDKKTVRVKEFTPTYKSCCEGNEPTEENTPSTLKYYVKLNEKLQPISGTLVRKKYKPKGLYQRILLPCCTVPIIDPSIPPIDPNEMTIAFSNETETGLINEDYNFEIKYEFINSTYWGYQLYYDFVSLENDTILTIPTIYDDCGEEINVNIPENEPSGVVTLTLPECANETPNTEIIVKLSDNIVE